MHHEFGVPHTALQSHSVIEPVSHTVRHHPNSGFLYYTLTMFCVFSLQFERIHRGYSVIYCTTHLSRDARDLRFMSCLSLIVTHFN